MRLKYAQLKGYIFAVLIALPYLSQRSIAQQSVDQISSTGVISTPTSGIGDPLAFQADLFTGRFTYSVPIKIPPARQGKEPKLTLGYKSSSRGGWCGFGWTLDCGYIQRDTRKGVPIQWGSTNALSEYDDSKGFIVSTEGSIETLVSIGPTNLNSILYRQQVDTSFLAYNFYTNDNYWTAVDKSGNTFFFGEGATNQMQNLKSGWTANTSQSTFRWELDKVIDENGNEIFMSYTFDGGMLYLTNISYDANTNAPGLTATHTIDFILTNRPDTNISFISGYRVQINKLLSEIDIKVSGTNNVRKYLLGYTSSMSTLRSMLTTVTEYGSDYSTPLPTLTLNYQTNAFTFNAVTNWPGVNSQGDNGDRWNSTSGCDDNYNTYVTTLDMDGDGLPDRVMRKINSPYTNYFAVQRNTGTGYAPVSSFYQWASLDNIDGQTDSGWNSPSVNNGSGTVYADLVDLNGDGYPDRILARYRPPSSQYTNWYIQFNSGIQSGGALALAQSIPVTAEAANSSSAWRMLRTALTVDLVDMNGDGLPDRVMSKLSAPFDRFKVQINIGGSFATNLLDWTGVDGQGQTSAAFNNVADHDGNNPVGYDVSLMDINGDGLPDRVMRKYGSPYSYFVVQYNNGAGFEPDENWGGSLFNDGNGAQEFNSPIATFVTDAARTFNIINMIDINGDGLPDRILSAVNSPFRQWYVQINTGTGFAPATVFGPWSSSDVQGHSDVFQDAITASYYFDSAFTGRYAFVDFFDINGDGLPDRIQQDNSSDSQFLVQLATGPFPDLLCSVSNGLGGSMQISYVASTTLDNRNTNWISDPWAEGTKSLLPFNVWVVSKISVNDGMGNSSSNLYTFKGGYYNAAEKEFRGFSQATVTDSKGTETITYFHQSGGRDNSALGEYLDQSSESKKGMPFRIDVIGDDGSTNKITLNKVQEVLLNSNGWYFPFVAQSVEMNYEGLNSYRATAKQFSYDTNTENLIETAYLGEVTNVVFSGQTFTNVGNNSIYTWITYTNIGSILNKPADVKTTSDSVGSIRLRETQMSYDSRGRMISSKVWLDSAGAFVTMGSDVYDQYGNLTQSTDATGITTTITYDSIYQQYPITEITGTFTNSSTPDVKSGVILMAVDAKGLVVSNVYDVFFRPIASFISTNSYGPPVLWQTRTSYSLGGISGDSSLNYVHNQVNDAVDTVNGFETYTYSDGLGRTIETRSEAETGQYRVANTVYDSRANPCFTTLPYFSPGSSYTVPSGILLGSLTEYDSIGRAFRSTSAVNGSFTSGQLIGTTATSGDTGSPVGAVSTAFVDGSNPWATVVTDANGKTKKSYRDAYGRTIQVTDIVSSGNINTTYGYDLLGNLTNVTDNTTTNSTVMGYDSLGRKTSMTDPDMGVWSYVYDNDGRLTQQTDARTNSIVFNYTDPLGRLVSKQIYNHASTLVGTVTYTYDTSDDGNYTVFPGQLYKVTDLQGYERFSYDVRGRTLKDARFLKVNAMEYLTQSTYDDADRIQQLTYPAGVATLQYSYDTAGHLSQVKSLSGTGANETFYTPTSFNGLDQLSGYANGNGVVTAYSYYSNSKRLLNITTSKSGTNDQNLSYTYDNVSDITSVGDGVYSVGASAAISSVTYDDLYRITTLNSTARGIKNYAYNSIGNILTNQDNGSVPYQYGLKPHAVTSANGVNYGYDAGGNMTIRGSQTLTYDEQNELARVTTMNGSVSFGYDDSGERLWRSGTNGYTVWIGGIYEINNGKVLCHVIADGQLIATFEPQCTAGLSKVFGEQNWFVASTAINSILAWPFQHGRGYWTLFGGSWAGIVAVCLAAGRGTRLKRYELQKELRPTCLFRQAVTLTVISAFLGGSIGKADAAPAYNPVFYYYHPDPLGSSNILTDRAGNVVQHYEYATFGQTSYQANTSAFPVSNRYTGQVADDETGLLYYGGRYYDPQLGRFIQPDPTTPDPTDSQSLNRYSYCRNNPLNETDPSGLDDFGGGYFGVNSSSYSSGYNSTTGSWSSTSWSTTLGGVTFSGGSGYMMGAGSYDSFMTSYGGSYSGSISGTYNNYSPSYVSDGMALGGFAVPSSFSFTFGNSQSAPAASGTAWSWSGLAAGVGLGLAGLAVGVALAPLIGLGLAAGGMIAAGTYAAVGVAALAGGAATGASIYSAASGRAWSLSGNGKTLSGGERSAAVGEAAIGVITLGLGSIKSPPVQRVWPSTAQEMNNFLKVDGRIIPDTATTPGRSKVVWDLGKSKITFEQHPYHPNAPDWHKGPHWHLDTPGNPHQRFLPGDPIP